MPYYAIIGPRLEVDFGPCLLMLWGLRVLDNFQDHWKLTWQVKIPTLVIHGDLDEAGDGSNDAAMDGQQSLVSI